MPLLKHLRTLAYKHAFSMITQRLHDLPIVTEKDKVVLLVECLEGQLGSTGAYMLEAVRICRQPPSNLRQVREHVCSASVSPKPSDFSEGTTLNFQ